MMKHSVRYNFVFCIFTHFIVFLQLSMSLQIFRKGGQYYITAAKSH